jgi:hypothetical protein
MTLTLMPCPWDSHSKNQAATANRYGPLRPRGVNIMLLVLKANLKNNS